MKIIIVGAGKVGYTLGENLVNEDYDVTIIDRNPTVIEKIEENLDALCLRGNGVRANMLIEAGVEESDLLIAVTGSDEVNMVCCLTAKKLGVHHTIARVRDPEYAHELSLLKEQLGLDVVINPEHAAAEEIAKALSFSSAMNVESFAKGRVRMIELMVTKEMNMVGKSIKEIDKETHSTVLLGVIVRKDEVIVPNGQTIIEVDDAIYIIGKQTNVYNFCKVYGKHPQRIKNVMLLGGGRISYYLTKLLGEMGIRTKIIEIDKERCLELSELLPNTLVINGDGTEEDVLRSENINDMDGFIAVTGIDEENLMSSLIAKRIGVKKIITKISRTNYINIVKDLGLESVISPKLITTNQILKFVRGRAVESLLKIIDGRAEIMEFVISESNKLLNKPLKELNIPDNVIIATIVRNKEVVVPHGNDVIKKGDRIIVISKDQNISSLYDLVATISGGIQNELRNGIKKLGNIINM